VRPRHQGVEGIDGLVFFPRSRLPEACRVPIPLVTEARNGFIL